MIWAWHSGVEAPPFYDVPEVPEFYDADWLPYEIKEFDVATCCQEMAENNVDFAHFMYVHGSPSIPDDEFEINGTYKQTVGAERHVRARGLRPRARRAAHRATAWCSSRRRRRSTTRT